MIRDNFKSYVLIILAILVLRTPSLFEPHWYGDEGVYLTIGNALRQGQVLYRDIYDNKPPAIYIIAMLSQTLFGMKLILLVWNTVTAVLFYNLLSKLFPQEKNLIILGISLFILFTASPLFEGNIANAEIFMILPVLGGFLLSWNFENRSLKKIFMAGLLFGLATLFKIPAIFDFLALFLFLLLYGLSSIGLIRISKILILLINGVLLPHLVVFLYFYFHSALSIYLSTVFIENTTYISRYGLPIIPYANIPVTPVVKSTVYLILLLIIFFIRKKLSKDQLLIYIWCITTLYSTTLSNRPYIHYLIQAIAPFILTNLCLYQSKFRDTVSKTLLILFMGTFFLFKFKAFIPITYYENFLFYALGTKTHGQYIRDFDPDTETVYRISSYISRNSAHSDRILVWGNFPHVYALSNRLPATPYTALYQIDESRKQIEAEKAMEKNPDAVILFPEEKPEPLKGLLNYFELKANINGALVWLRNK